MEQIGGQGLLPRNLPSRLYRRLRWHLYFDLGGGPEDTLFLAGSPRGGTTWAAELVVYRQNLRFVFEPFHPDRVEFARSFRPRQYLRPEWAEPQLVQAANRLVAGQIRSWWTDHYTRSPLPRKRLVKEVRANLILAWLKTRFPEMRVALLLRHPCAVAASQLSAGWDFHTEVDYILAQPELVDDYLRDHKGLLQRSHSRVEQQVLMWCIENFVPIQQFRRSDIHVLFYENLVREPKRELQRLLEFFGLPFHEDVLTRVPKPSQTTMSSSVLAKGGDSIVSWRNQLSAHDVAGAMALLSAFGLDRIYGPDPLPQLDSSEALLP